MASPSRSIYCSSVYQNTSDVSCTRCGYHVLPWLVRPPPAVHQASSGHKSHDAAVHVLSLVAHVSLIAVLLLGNVYCPDCAAFIYKVFIICKYTCRSCFPMLLTRFLSNPVPDQSPPGETRGAVRKRRKTAGGAAAGSLIRGKNSSNNSSNSGRSSTNNIS